MPTIPMAKESSLHNNTKESRTKKPLSLERRGADSEFPSSEALRVPSAQRLYSPALYATPELAPIPDVPLIGFSPNNYVVNRKRRDLHSLPATQRLVNGFEKHLEADDANGGDGIPSSAFSGNGYNINDDDDDKFSGDDNIDEEPCDDFFSSRDSLNVGTSGSDTDDAGGLSRGMLSNQISFKSRSQDEYYDTAEEFFSDGSFSISSPSLKRSLENELHSLRLSLIEESTKRKMAEGNLLYLNKLYEMLLKCLFRQSSSLPELPDFENLQTKIDPAEICQEFIVLKSVSDSLEAELAKDEVEESFREIIDAKTHEVSRLRDRLTYYEAVNRELSQWNQETVDIARKRRLRRRRMRRWFWGCVGLSIAAGVSLLCYSHLPHHRTDLSSDAGSSSSDTSAANAVRLE